MSQKVSIEYWHDQGAWHYRVTCGWAVRSDSIPPNDWTTQDIQKWLLSVWPNASLQLLEDTTEEQAESSEDSKHKPKYIWVCQECKGAEIESRAWVDPNTEEVQEYEESCDSWCRTCEAEVTIELVEQEKPHA